MSETAPPPFYLVVELGGYHPIVEPGQVDRSCWATTDASHVVGIVFDMLPRYRVLKVFSDGSTSIWYDYVDPTKLDGLTFKGLVSSLESL